MTPYEQGSSVAFEKLGIALHVRQRKDPYTEIHRRLQRVFKLKMPKFDFAKLIARLLKSPFRQIGMQLAGKGRPLRY